MQTAFLTQGFLFTHGKKGFINSWRILTGAQAAGRPRGVGEECEGSHQDVLTEIQGPLPQCTVPLGPGAGSALRGYSHRRGGRRASSVETGLSLPDTPHGGGPHSRAALTCAASAPGPGLSRAPPSLPQPSKPAPVLPAQTPWPAAAAARAPSGGAALTSRARGRRTAGPEPP